MAVAETLAAGFRESATRRDRERHRTWDEVDVFSRSDLWSMNVPRAHGGPALFCATVATVFAIVAASDASMAEIARNHVSLVDILRFDPNEARKRDLLGQAIAGVRFGSPLPARDAQHPLGIPTLIVRDGDGFVVSGHMAYAAGPLFAHIVPVQAVDENGKTTLTLLDRNTQGAVAEAKIVANDVALLLGNKLFEMTGTRAVLEHLNLDIYWRNARTHTLHDPVRWKYHFVGDYRLNGKTPPRTGTL